MPASLSVCKLQSVLHSLQVRLGRPHSKGRERFGADVRPSAERRIIVYVTADHEAIEIAVTRA